MNGRISLIVIFLSGVILFSPVSSRAETSRVLLETAQDKYETLLKSEKRRSSKTMWLEVINAFDRVVKQYPRSEEAPRALFTEGCIWREMFNYSITLGELYKAEEVFKKFIKTYPAHSLVADAKKNIEEIQDQKKRNNLVRVYTEKPNPEKFPGRETALKEDVKTPGKTQKKETTPEKKDAKRSTPPSSSAPAAISKIRYFTDSSRTRVVVDLDAAVTYNDAVLDKSGGKPHRIYVDLIGAQVCSGLYSPLMVKDGLVSRIRWSKTKEGVIRVVLDLEEKADYKVFSLANPHRVVIDVERN